MSKVKVPNIISMCRRCSVATNVLPRNGCSLLSESPGLSTLQCLAHRQVFTSTITNKTFFEGLNLLSSDQDAVSKVVSDAEKIVGYPTSFLNLRCLLSDELSNIAMQMRKLVGTQHPLLKTARGMILDGRHNRQMRGLLVMLIAKAAGPNADSTSPDDKAISGIYNSQRSLAEITEVIHTAILIHKGVVNLDKLSSDQQGSLSDMAFGNKISVLSGDYLLGSACFGLAEFGNPTVVENIASSIGDMMTAEFTKYTNECGEPTIPESCTGFSDWLSQTFLSIGSLLSKSCEAALMLSGHSKHLQYKAYSFGKNLTFSHQLARDILPFVDKKEVQNLSLTSGPILLYKETASPEEFSRLQQLWEGGVANYDKIVSEVNDKGIVEMCRERCQFYRDEAISSLDCFPQSDAKTALISMTNVMSEPVH